MQTYLDHHATTPCDPAVVAAMAPWWSDQFANPASRQYRPGLAAAAAVERARSRVAELLGAGGAQVVFTSGATEANNLAIKGVAEAALAAGGKRRRLVSLATEHRAVLDPLRYLERHGFPLTLLPVQADGLPDMAQLQAALGPDVLLLSAMAANNEIGVLAPLAPIAQLCRHRGVLFHCDAAQAAGHIPLAMEQLGIDLLSLSGHKCYGPKGVGALYVRRSKPRVRITAQMDGGGHERGMRSGTLNVASIVGFGAAAEIARLEGAEESARVGRMRDRLRDKLFAELDLGITSERVEKRIASWRGIHSGRRRSEEHTSELQSLRWNPVI
jgi:cysteine desulfurase